MAIPGDGWNRSATAKPVVQRAASGHVPTTLEDRQALS